MQSKTRTVVLFSVLMLFSFSCSFVPQLPSRQNTPSGPGIPTSQVPANLPDPAPINSAQALENVATVIYSALANGQTLTSYIDGVMTAFGVPPLGEADLALVQERYSKSLPLMFMPQVAEMSDAFTDGGYVTLDSFITAANNRGARQEGSGEPLTREYLTREFEEYTGKTQYEAGQVLPAFVLALGQERARRFPPENSDPLWGDGLLDPLQLTLLLYSVSYSGAGRLSAQPSLTAAIAYQDVEVSFVQDPVQAPPKRGVTQMDRIKDWIKDQIADEVTGEVQDLVEVPLDKVEAAQVSICASLLLYGHKLEVKNTPNLLYHKDGEKPWTTQVDITLTFQDDYWDNYLQIDRWVLENLAGCDLPRKGPVEGKPLEWSVSDGLNGHGNFNVIPSQTNGEGRASASWQTVPETTPKSQRTFHNQRDAVGAIIVRAGSLVPGWSGLERIVGLLRDTGNTGDAPLTVIYYVPQGYRITGQEGQQQVTYSGTVCNLEKPFTLKANTNWWEMTFELTPASAQAGTFSVTGTHYDVGPYAGQGTYTVQPVNEELSQLTLNFTTLTETTSLGVIDVTPSPYHVELIPLDTRECD